MSKKIIATTSPFIVVIILSIIKALIFYYFHFHYFYIHDIQYEVFVSISFYF